MADHDIYDELDCLTAETKKVLLTEIKEAAPEVGANLLDDLAYAYALVVGAQSGKLPGRPFEVNTE